MPTISATTFRTFCLKTSGSGALEILVVTGCNVPGNDRALSRGEVGFSMASKAASTLALPVLSPSSRKRSSALLAACLAGISFPLAM